MDRSLACVGHHQSARQRHQKIHILKMKLHKGRLNRCQYVATHRDFFWGIYVHMCTHMQVHTCRHTCKYTHVDTHASTHM